MPASLAEAAVPQAEQLEDNCPAWLDMGQDGALQFRQNSC